VSMLKEPVVACTMKKPTRQHCMAAIYVVVTLFSVMRHCRYVFAYLRPYITISDTRVPHTCTCLSVNV